MIERTRNALVVSILVLWAAYSVLCVFGNIAVSNVLSPMLALLVSIALFLAGRVSPTHKISWFATAACAFSWSVSDTLWAVYTFTGADPEESILLLYLYLLPNIFLLMALINISFSELMRWTALQFMVDTAALLLSLFGFAFFVFLKAWMNAASATLSDFATSMGSVGTDVLILTLIASFLVTVKLRSLPLPMYLLFIGDLFYVCTDIAYIYQDWTGLYSPNGLIDSLYMLAFAFFGIGAAIFAPSPVEITRARQEALSLNAIVNRAILLFIVPLVLPLFHRPVVEEIIYFAVVILLHQIVSQFLRGSVLRSIAAEENARLNQRLELMIAERTRELEVMNQTLENLLNRDETTGQFNRKYFIDNLERLLRETEKDTRIWFILVDFDRFKTINDTYGHDVGDSLLRAIGRRLETAAGQDALFARLGGDEFGIAITLPATESVHELVRSISELIDAPVSLSHYTLRVSYSVGVSCWPVDAQNRSDLMRHADIALYQAKKNRSRRVAYFEQNANAIVERRHQLDLALGKADFDKEFSLVYQPQFSVEGRILIGMEALVRWNSNELGSVPPDDFIPVAEENGMILPLSDWIMRTALSTLARWNAEGRRDLTMGINVSPIQFNDIYFFANLSRLITELGVNPYNVNVEITERTAMADESLVTDVLDRLSSLGVISSIDDFGTGYSSLSYLKRYRINYLKIAKPLIDSIALNETDTEIVQAIVQMAKALKIRTIAEGVEDADQFDILQSLCCDEIQGYYLGRPVPPDDFERLYLS